MTTQSNIDLNTCVPGQPLRLHDKRIVKYGYKMSESNEGYCHVIDNATYTNSGKFWEAIGRKSSLDVAEILSMEEEPFEVTPKPIHLITDQIDLANPDHVSIIPNEHGVTISIKKGLTTISWRHYNS